MAPPLLVVEVVSPGDIQRNRDYIAKRLQDQGCDIPEYWIVDPQMKQVLVLKLRDAVYQEFGIFSQGEALRSPQLVDLSLNVSEIFMNA